MEKAEISFKLVDKYQKNWFTYSEFATCMQGLIGSWVAITGQQLSRFVD